VRPTIKVIAKEAGCSAMTVSLALRNHPRISAETRNRILSIAKRLDYRPNPMVSTLMTHIRSSRPVNYQSNLAFLAFPKAWTLRWVSHDLYEGISQRAQDLGFFLDKFWLGEPDSRPGSLEKVLWARNIQGVIIAPLPELGTLDELSGWAQWSAVSIGNSLDRPRLHRATHHQHHGMSLILEKLRAKGYRRIGLGMNALVDDKVDRLWTSCMAGFQLRLPARERVPILLDDLGTAAVKKWVERYRPDVAVGHDGLLDQLLKIGLRVPEDIAFAHVSLPTQFSSLALSGLNQNWKLAGAAAVDSVVAQIHRNERGVPESPKTMMVEGSWIEGETAPDRK